MVGRGVDAFDVIQLRYTFTGGGFKFWTGREVLENIESVRSSSIISGIRNKGRYMKELEHVYFELYQNSFTRTIQITID